MAKFDVELDYKGIKAVRSVKTRVSVQTAKLFKSHPASHVKPKLILRIECAGFAALSEKLEYLEN